MENYGMVPGINNQNKVEKSPTKEVQKTAGDDRFEKERKWLGEFGYYRGTEYHGPNVNRSFNGS